MQVVGENGLLDLESEFPGVVTGVGADFIAHAGGNVPGARGGVAAARLRLVDPDPLDNGLQQLVDLVHVLVADSRNLKALAHRHVHGAVSVGFRDLLDHGEIFRVQMAAGYPDAGGGEPPLFCDAERVFLQLLCIDIHSLNAS